MSDGNVELLVWDVEVPGKQQSFSTWDRRPRGKLIVAQGNGHAETITIPKSVARVLKAKCKSGEIHPESREQLFSMVAEVTFSCARMRVQRLTDRREYSSDEVRQKLRDDGYPESAIDTCVSRACEVGLISDRRYADVFIRSKITAGWGTSRISRELLRRGIDVKSLPGWPYDYVDPEDELERATELAHSKCLYGTPTFPKLVRYLCGKGYTTSVAARAASMVINEDQANGLVDF